MISRGKVWGGKQKFGGYVGIALTLFVAVPMLPRAAHAQLKSNIANVNLNASLSSSITVIAAPGLVNFALVRNGVANGNAPVSITTSWTLPILIGTVTEYAYFSSATAALSDGASDNIPSASVSASANGGAYTAFTGTSPFAAGSSVTLFSQFIVILLNSTSARTDTLNLRIDTTGLNLPAGTYTGVLHIQAQAI